MRLNLMDMYVSGLGLVALAMYLDYQRGKDKLDRQKASDHCAHESNHKDGSEGL